MNIKISSIRKEDNRTLYFFDDEVMEQYIHNSGGEDAYEFNGFQVVPYGEEVIDTDSWRADFMKLAQGSGIDVKTLKKHEIFGIADPEEDEEERKRKAKEIMTNQVAVFKINDDGTVEETDDDVEEFIKERNKEMLEKTVEKLKEKALEYGMDPEEIMGDGNDNERYNRLADAIWEKVKKDSDSDTEEA